MIQPTERTCVTFVALSYTSAALIAAAPIDSLPVRPIDHGCRVLQRNRYCRYVQESVLAPERNGHNRAQPVRTVNMENLNGLLTWTLIVASVNWSVGETCSF